MGDNKQKDLSMTSSNFGGRGWIIILLVGFSIFLQSSIINDSLNVTIPFFERTFKWDPRTLYAFSTITAWIGIVAAAVWGMLAKKSAKKVWVVSLGIAVVMLLFWAQANEPNRLWIYAIALLATSIAGQGFNYTGSYTVINNWFPRKKGMAMGWVTIGFPVSAMFSAMLVQAIFAKSGELGISGISGVYYFYAIIAAVLLVLVLVFVKNYPEQLGKFPDNDKSLDRATLDAELKRGIEHARTSIWTMKKVFTTPNVYKIGITYGVFGLIALGVMTNFIPRATAVGYNYQEIIPMLMLTGAVACVGSPLCGVLDAKVGPKKAAIYTMFLGAVALLVNIIPNRVCMYISLPMIGVLLGGSANYLVSITTSIWGRYDFPNAYRVLIMLNNFVAAAGVMIVGWIGNTEGLGYTVAYAVLAGLAVVSAIVMFSIKDKKVDAS